MSFHRFFGKAGLNNTVFSASFEKPSYNPVFASVTYILRAVFILFGKAYLFRTSISLPLVFKDRVCNHVTFLVYFILSLLIILQPEICGNSSIQLLYKANLNLPSFTFLLALLRVCHPFQ